MAWVYILRGSSGRHYIGSAVDFDARFAQHLRGHTATTKRLGDIIEIVAKKEVPTLVEAREIERLIEAKEKILNSQFTLCSGRAARMHSGLVGSSKSPPWQFQLRMADC
jgi:predicted GIY-YIG superfamily endonuclease